MYSGFANSRQLETMWSMNSPNFPRILRWWSVLSLMIRLLWNRAARLWSCAAVIGSSVSAFSPLFIHSHHWLSLDPSLPLSTFLGTFHAFSLLSKIPVVIAGRGVLPSSLPLFSLLRDLRNQTALCNRLLSIKQRYLMWNTGLQKRLHTHGENVGNSEDSFEKVDIEVPW